MTAYYNEICPTAVLWLREAMKENIIPQGHIDTRSIQDVEAKDLIPYTQHHFFAGIGGWSIALRLAGWEDTRPVWTGSPPCQPFSSAGRQKGKEDKRHLWPEWFRLIKEHRPTTIFGEQVAAAITQGWLDSIYDDLEGESYAVGSAVLPACSVGKAHRRDRLWFVADSRCIVPRYTQPRPSGEWDASGAQSLRTETRDGLADSGVVGNTEYNGQSSASFGGISDSDARQSEEGTQRTQQFATASASEPMGNTHTVRLQGFGTDSAAQGWEEQNVRQAGLCNGAGLQLIQCPDGKFRAVEPSIHLLANGIPSRLRKAAIQGYGNAIVPEVAAEFIKAFKQYGEEK